jgi:hypothetical protein
MIFGSMRSAKEHALTIVKVIRAMGCTNRAIYQGEIEDMHADICGELGWMFRKWDAVGRELARLPGVKRDEFKLNGQRLTAYEVAPLEEAPATVVDLVAVKANRAQP